MLRMKKLMEKMIEHEMEPWFIWGFIRIILNVVHAHLEVRLRHLDSDYTGNP